MRLVLHLENGGEQRAVTRDRFTIGRAQENDWVLPDPERTGLGVEPVAERVTAG